MKLHFYLPLRLVSEANAHTHWRARAKRAKEQRVRVALGWHAANLPALKKPSTVRLTRLSPRRLDDDNLASAFKAVRDEVAFQCGFDDRDLGVRVVRCGGRLRSADQAGYCPRSR